jgi:hypothetical protein
MLRHGANAFFSQPQSDAALRTPASSSFTIYSRRLTSPIRIDLAVGWRGVIDGCQRVGRPSLHELAPVGQEIPVIRRSGTFGPTKSGRPRIYGKDVDTDVIKAAAARPKDLGLPFTTWSLPKLQEYLSQQPGLKGITRSTICRVISSNLCMRAQLTHTDEVRTQAGIMNGRLCREKSSQSLWRNNDGPSRLYSLGIIRQERRARSTEWFRSCQGGQTRLADI